MLSQLKNKKKKSFYYNFAYSFVTDKQYKGNKKKKKLNYTKSTITSQAFIWSCLFLHLQIEIKSWTWKGLSIKLWDSSFECCLRTKIESFLALALDGVPNSWLTFVIYLSFVCIALIQKPRIKFKGISIMCIRSIVELKEIKLNYFHGNGSWQLDISIVVGFIQNKYWYSTSSVILVLNLHVFICLDHLWIGILYLSVYEMNVTQMFINTWAKFVKNEWMTLVQLVLMCLVFIALFCLRKKSLPQSNDQIDEIENEHFPCTSWIYLVLLMLKSIEIHYVEIEIVQQPIIGNFFSLNDWHFAC